MNVNIAASRIQLYIQKLYQKALNLLPFESSAELMATGAHVLQVDTGRKVEGNSIVELLYLGNVEHSGVLELVSHSVLGTARGGSGKAEGASAGVSLDTDAAEVLVAG